MYGGLRLWSPILLTLPLDTAPMRTSLRWTARSKRASTCASFSTLFSRGTCDKIWLFILYASSRATKCSLISLLLPWRSRVRRATRCKGAVGAAAATTAATASPHSIYCIGHRRRRRHRSGPRPTQPPPPAGRRGGMRTEAAAARARCPLRLREGGTAPARPALHPPASPPDTAPRNGGSRRACTVRGSPSGAGGNAPPPAGLQARGEHPRQSSASRGDRGRVSPPPAINEPRRPPRRQLGRSRRGRVSPTAAETNAHRLPCRQLGKSGGAGVSHPLAPLVARRPPRQQRAVIGTPPAPLPPRRPPAASAAR